MLYCSSFSQWVICFLIKREVCLLITYMFTSPKGKTTSLYCMTVSFAVSTCLDLSACLFVTWLPWRKWIIIFTIESSANCNKSSICNPWSIFVSYMLRKPMFLQSMIFPSLKTCNDSAIGNLSTFQTTVTNHQNTDRFVCMCSVWPLFSLFGRWFLTLNFHWWKLTFWEPVRCGGGRGKVRRTLEIALKVLIRKRELGNQNGITLNLIWD